MQRRRGPAVTYSLDNLLAFEFPAEAQVQGLTSDEYRDRNLSLCISQLDKFLSLNQFKGTSVETDLVPAAENMKVWFRKFNDNMSDLTMRLQGCLRARICYAQKGFELVRELQRIAIEEIDRIRIFASRVDTDETDILTSEDDIQQITQFINSFVSNSAYPTFMKNWLLLLSYEFYRQSVLNSDITTQNVNELKEL